MEQTRGGGSNPSKPCSFSRCKRIEQRGVSTRLQPFGERERGTTHNNFGHTTDKAMANELYLAKDRRRKPFELAVRVATSRWDASG